MFSACCDGDGLCVTMTLASVEIVGQSESKGKAFGNVSVGRGHTDHRLAHTPSSEEPNEWFRTCFPGDWRS